MFSKMLKIVKHPSYLFIALCNRFHIYLSDSLYLKIFYKYKFNKRLDLSNPVTFNEKLQWLKLYDRKNIYTVMVDKYEAKKYVGDIIGDEYIIPTIGIYEKFDDIDFDKLPNQFVMKCTHDSHGLVIVKDKSCLDINLAKKKINKSLNRNYYYFGREWPYKNVKPRIIIEEYKEDYSGELIDYKVYAFNGKCDYVLVCFDRQKGATKFIYFDKNWNMKKEFTNDGIKYGDIIKLKKPKNLDKMFQFASILSKDIPFVRVDFYEVNGSLYFGELTFYPSSGFDSKRRKEADEYLSNQLTIVK